MIAYEVDSNFTDRDHLECKIEELKAVLERAEQQIELEKHRAGQKIEEFKEEHTSKMTALNDQVVSLNTTITATRSS